MRKIFIISTLFSFGLLFSQTKKEEPTKVEVLPKSSISPKLRTKIDTLKSPEIRKEDSNSRFYKNMTDEKASQYKMLKKITRSSDYQAKNTQQFKTDSIQKLKEIKPLDK